MWLNATTITIALELHLTSPSRQGGGQCGSAALPASAGKLQTASGEYCTLIAPGKTSADPAERNTPKTMSRSLTPLAPELQKRR